MDSAHLMLSMKTGISTRRGQFCIIGVREEGEMQTAKQEVSDLLKRLPDDCTLEDVQYHLYVLQKIERGLKDAEEGRVFTQERVQKMMSKWLEKKFGPLKPLTISMRLLIYL